jgi:carbon monoxide dehydrogenase subunit G
MLHFEGEKEFAQPAAELWSKLSDARFLVQCVPGLEAVAQAEPGVAQGTLRPGFSFVRGTLEMTLRVAEAVPHSSVRLQVHGKGIGSTSNVETGVTLTPQANGTRLHWTADIKELGGLLKAVPQGLIKASAQKVITDVWSSLEAKLMVGHARVDP